MIKWFKNLFAIKQELILECEGCGNTKKLIIDRTYYKDPRKIDSLVRCLGCYKCDGNFKVKG